MSWNKLNRRQFVKSAAAAGVAAPYVLTHSTLADMGAHHFDIAQWALEMDDSGPTKIEPPASGDSGLEFTYDNGVEMYHGGRSGCTFEGTEGTLYVNRGKTESNPGGIATEKIGDDEANQLLSREPREPWSYT